MRFLSSLGFGLDDVESFRFVDCPLPNIPLSVILHRTSIKVIAASNDTLGDANDGSGSGDGHFAQREVVSEVKSLRLQFTQATKMSLNHLKTLFNGLDSLEKLSLRNVQIDSASDSSLESVLPNSSSSSSSSSSFNNQGSSSSKLTGPSRVFITRFKRSSFTSSLISLTEVADGEEAGGVNNATTAPTEEINGTESIGTPFVGDEAEARSAPVASEFEDAPVPVSLASTRTVSNPGITSHQVNNQGHGSTSRTVPVSLHVRFTSKPSTSTMATTASTTVIPLSGMSASTFTSPSTVAAAVTTAATTAATTKYTPTSGTSTTTKAAAGQSWSTSPSPSTTQASIRTSVNDEPLVVDLSKDTIAAFDLPFDASHHRTTRAPAHPAVRGHNFNFNNNNHNKNFFDLHLGQVFPKLKSVQLENVFPIESRDNSLALKELLKGCRNLENIQLSNNQIPILFDHTFNASANSLKRLYLIGNGIRQLEPSAFAFLKSLQILDLFNNNLTTIPTASFRDLASLSMLRIAKNSFVTLPDDLLDYSPALKSLNLNLNRNLTHIPYKLLSATSALQNFSLVDCGLTSLSKSPEQMFYFAPSIEQVELRGNKLRNLTARGLFAFNPFLKKIDLSYNDIQVISPEIFSHNSSNLVELNLYGNNLVEIDSSTFSNLKNLRVLRLGFNNLNTISADLLFSLRKLEELDLSRNQLVNVNSHLSRLPFGLGTANLRRINLSRNNLTDFTEFSVIDWSLYLKIAEINLSGNRITGRVSLPVFHSTAPHVVLDLSSNLITSINMDDIIAYESAVIQLTKDERIASDLRSYNVHREKRTPDSFGDSRSSSWRQLPPSQTIIRLDKNPLECDCLLETFIQYANSSSNDLDAASLRGILNRVSFDFYSPNLKCSTGTPLHQVNPINLTCRILDRQLCPHSCSCTYRSFDSSAIIDCSHKGLLQVPESIVSPASYTNITLEVPPQGGKNEVARSTTTSPTQATNGNKAGLPSTANFARIVKKVTLLLDNNQIENVDPLNKILAPPQTETGPPPASPTTSLSFGGTSYSSRRAQVYSPIAFELYLDNNRIESLPEDFLKDAAAASKGGADAVISSASASFHPPGSASDEDAGDKYVSGHNDKSDDGDDSPSPLSTAGERRMKKEFVQSGTGSSLASVTLLSLRGNQLSFIPHSVLTRLAGMNGSLSDKFTAMEPLKLFLGDNPYNCTADSGEEDNTNDQCGQLYFKNWLTQHFNLVGDVQDVQCVLGSSGSSVQIIAAADSELCPVSETSGFFVFSIICLIISLILVIVSVLYHRNRQTVLAFMYIHINPIFVCLNLVHEDDLDQDKLYDAFVSYSSADRDIVMEMISKLEQPSDLTKHSISFLQQQSGVPSIHEGHCDQIVPEHAVDDGRKAAKCKGPANGESDPSSPENRYYTLCIHERDWLPGNLISWNIVNSVQNSRRTILVISKEFLQSIWFQVEFHTAYYQMLEDQMDRLIVVVRGELPPKEDMDKDLVFLLTTKTYLVWGEKWFWEKLRYALPHSKQRKEVAKSTNQRSKAEIMRDYVDQTIHDHFQLQSRKNGKTPHINRAFVGETQA